MGLFGVVIAMVVNLFLRSDAVGFVLSCCSVVVFTGLTAYDTQKIRAVAGAHDDRLALSGALMLYLDFINLFLALLRLFGRRR
jgi:FtsH-binding integral membrane protein